MSFRGIPDAELDPHPRRTWAIEMGFDACVRCLYRKQEIWPVDFPLEPGTLVVSNHQRDSDVPIIGTVLCRRRGLRFRWPLAFFVAREDLFRSGFLTEYFSGWPVLGPLVGHIRLQWFFKAARAYPMRRVREFSLLETLDAARATSLGAAEVQDVFNARGQRELHALLGRLPARVANLDRHRLRGLSHWGLRRLRLKALRQIAPGFRATVAEQLEVYVRLLDAGRVVYIAPEGLISETGAFGRVRLGTRWLYRHAAQRPAVLPVALSYDALAPGRRWRVIVHIGRPVRELDASSETLFAAQLRRMLQELYMLNPSHLLARFLIAGPQRFSSDEFQAWMRRAIKLAVEQNLVLDPLLRRTPGELWTRRFRWLQARHLIGREGTGWRNLLDREAAPGWQQPPNIVRYLDNTLIEVAPGLSRELQA